MVQNSNFFTWRDFFAPELEESHPESFPPEFLPILAVLWPKIAIRSFWPRCDQMVKNLNFFIWRDFFAPYLNESGLESFPGGTFTNFGCPTAENCDSVFLTGVRQKPGIGFWRCDQMVQNSNFLPGESFWPQSLTKVVPKVSLPGLLPIFPSYIRKFRFGLFYQCATKT